MDRRACVVSYAVPDGQSTHAALGRGLVATGALERMSERESHDPDCDGSLFHSPSTPNRSLSSSHLPCSFVLSSLLCAFLSLILDVPSLSNENPPPLSITSCWGIERLGSHPPHPLLFLELPTAQAPRGASTHTYVHTHTLVMLPRRYTSSSLKRICQWANTTLNH